MMHTTHPTCLVKVVNVMCSEMDLGEGFKLCSGLCIGARAGREKNQLLLSFDVGTVQIYDVSDTRYITLISLIYSSCMEPHAHTCTSLLWIHRLYLTIVLLVGSFHRTSVSPLQQSTTLHQITTGLCAAAGESTPPIQWYICVNTCTVTVMGCRIWRLMYMYVGYRNEFFFCVSSWNCWAGIVVVMTCSLASQFLSLTQKSSCYWTLLRLIVLLSSIVVGVWLWEEPMYAWLKQREIKHW